MKPLTTVRWLLQVGSSRRSLGLLWVPGVLVPDHRNRVVLVAVAVAAAAAAAAAAALLWLLLLLLLLSGSVLGLLD